MNKQTCGMVNMQKWRMKLYTYSSSFGDEDFASERIPNKNLFLIEANTKYMAKLSRSISDTSPEKQYLVIYLILIIYCGNYLMPFYNHKKV